MSVISMHSPEKTEKNHEDPHLRRFEPRTYQSDTSTFKKVETSCFRTGGPAFFFFPRTKNSFHVVPKGHETPPETIFEN
jgi:hypothetical protein